MIIIFYWWTCPNGHKHLILEEEKDGKMPISCEDCSFIGKVSEGILGEKEAVPEAFGNLRG